MAELTPGTRSWSIGKGPVNIKDKTLIRVLNISIVLSLKKSAEHEYNLFDLDHNLKSQNIFQATYVNMYFSNLKNPGNSGIRETSKIKK